VIDIRDGLLVLEVAYDERLVAEVREIRGRRWESTSKVWTFPTTAIRPLRALAAAHAIETTEEVDALPDLDPIERPLIGIAAGRYVLRFAYDADLVARVREIDGARWDARGRAWTVPLDAEAEVARFIVDTDSTIEASADGHLDEARDALAAIDASMSSDAAISIPGLAGDLLPFQRAGVAYALAAMGR
jgi:hypothetical protein